MGLVVFNTLTQRKEPFVPRHPHVVAIYQCGITPYDYTHLGHARQYVFWDVVCRYLEYKGYRTLCIQNFTDIDDKLIARARETGKSVREVAEYYAADFLEAMDALGVRRVSAYPRATDHIPDIIEMISILVDKGVAYQLDGDVYFDVSRFPDYGKLSHKKPEELVAGARVEVDQRKRDPADFALWKGAKPGEPSWPSPWGPGRPGWHIECSAMALKYLGMGFDMHGGGTDLVFPHHENEIAQSEAYAGTGPFVRYWVHHEMLNVGSEKMSKSLKNFFNAKAAIQEFGAPAVRLFLISAHYRSPAAFGQEELEAAGAAYERLRACFADARFARAAVARGAGDAEAGGEEAGGGGGYGLEGSARQAVSRFVTAMDDDFNTPAALAAIFELVTAVNAHLQRAPSARGWLTELDQAVTTLGDLACVLGLVEKPKLGGGFEVVEPAGVATGTGGGGLSGVSVERLVDTLLRMRDEARKARDFARADRLRAELETAGVIVEDTPLGARWRVRR